MSEIKIIASQNWVNEQISTAASNYDAAGSADAALTEAKAYTDSEVAFYTPVKGVDYWTEADQESIVQQVIAALGTPVFGTVDADNNIILTGNLTGDTYTVKYEKEDGTLIEVGEIVMEADESGEVTIVWKTNVKIDKTTGAEAADTSGNYASTEPIELKDGYTYTLYASGNTSDSCPTNNFCFYDADGGYLGYTAGIQSYTQTSVVIEPPAGAKTFKIRAWTLANEWNLLEERFTLMMEKKQVGTYTNQIPISTDTDGSIFNGKGWIENKRLNSSGVVSDVGTYGYTGVTGFIPIADGDVIRTSANMIDPSGSTQQSVSFYDADKAFIARYQYYSSNNRFSYDLFTVNDDYSFTWTHDDDYLDLSSAAAYVRFCFAGITDDAVITKNEEIV